MEPVYNPEAELSLLMEQHQWPACPDGLIKIGHQDDGFHFSNEMP